MRRKHERTLPATVIIGDFITGWASSVAGFFAGLVIFPLTRPFLRMADQARVLREKNVHYQADANRKALFAQATAEGTDYEHIDWSKPAPLSRHHVRMVILVAAYDIYHVALKMPAYFLYEMTIMSLLSAYSTFKHGLPYALENAYDSVHYSANYGGDNRHSRDTTVKSAHPEEKDGKYVSLKTANNGEKLYDPSQHFYFSRIDLIATLFIVGLMAAGVAVGLHGFGVFHLVAFVAQNLHFGASFAAHMGSSAVYGYIDTALFGFATGFVATLVVTPIQYLAISGLKGLGLALSSYAPEHGLLEPASYLAGLSALVSVPLAPAPNFDYHWGRDAQQGKKMNTLDGGGGSGSDSNSSSSSEEDDDSDSKELII